MGAERSRRGLRLADVVADDLRGRILDGSIADGSMLPKQEELIERFGVSPPSVREALRVLEAEGLISVKRGNVGGAVVSLPGPEQIGYMLAMVLRARLVELRDVADALAGIEALCAETAAKRPDRQETVIPRLEARMRESHASVGDIDAFMRSAHGFHEDLVSACGNETLVLMAGAVEVVWAAHLEKYERTPGAIRKFEDPDFRRRSQADHEAIVQAIANGEAEQAAVLVRAHMVQPELEDILQEQSAVHALSMGRGRERFSIDD